MFFKLMKLHLVCIRLKSCKSKITNVKEIKRMHFENKILFGELLESAKVKKKTKEKRNEHAKEKYKNITVLNIDKRTGKSRTDISPTPQCKNAQAMNLVTNEEWVFTCPLLNLKKNLYQLDSSTNDNAIIKLVNDHNDYSSISLILSESMPTQSVANLQRWRENMISKLGPEEFKSYNRNLMAQGANFRRLILNYLKGVPENELDVEEDFVTYWDSLKPVFPLFSRIIEIEGLVAHKRLKYKGLFDCLSIFRNEVVLVSWKKSDKYVPSLERTFDMPLHVVACMGALNFDDRYHFRVEKALLVMAYNNGRKADIFYLDKEKCSQYWQQWLRRLSAFILRSQEKSSVNYDGLGKKSEKINMNIELSKIFQKGHKRMNVTLENLSHVDYPSSESTFSYPLFNDEKGVFDFGKPSIIKPNEYTSSLYPSVTSVLSNTKSEFAKLLLERWRQNMIEKLGNDKFEQYYKETLEAGSKLHELICRYLQDKDKKKLEVPDSLRGFWQSIQPVFTLISNVMVTETGVVHPVLKYRGIIDCVASYNDKLVIIDWKTSEKVRASVSQTYDAPLQVAAYIGAVNYDDSYPFIIDEGLIVVMYNDGSKANVFHMNREKCLKYWRRWLQRLDKYNTAAFKDGNYTSCIREEQSTDEQLQLV